MTKVKSSNSRYPAIVVVGYNRLRPLQRLLHSLEIASYPSAEIPLIISLDFAFSDELRKYAESFKWSHGSKQVIAHTKQLGLRAHVLSCGDLSREFSSVIVLEDDLYVGPYFYSYTQQAQDYYQDDSKVAGVALYSHCFNEAAGLSFTPLSDASDVFFMQWACSWGQLWNHEQWSAFREWLGLFDERRLDSMLRVPLNVRSWPSSSWKKLMIAYLIDQEKYFVYPRVSQTTNFSDPGANYDFVENHLQVPLDLVQREFRFSSLAESKVLYDAYCELTPDCLLELAPGLSHSAQELEVDLYGSKPRELLTPLWFTSKSVNNAKKRFRLSLKPHEVNSRMAVVESGELKLAEHSGLCSTESAVDVYERLQFYFGVPKELVVTRPAFNSIKRELDETFAELASVKGSKAWKVLRGLRSFLNPLRRRGGE